MSSIEAEPYLFFEERSNTMVHASSLAQLITRLRQQYGRTGMGNIDYELVRALVCERYPQECETLPIPLIENAKHFIKAMKDWNRGGRLRVSEETFNQRKSTCLACPNWRGLHSAEVGFCSLCKCSAGKLSLKLWIPTEKCPAGKWVASPVATE